MRAPRTALASLLDRNVWRPAAVEAGPRAGETRPRAGEARVVAPIPADPLGDDAHVDRGPGRTGIGAALAKLLVAGVVVALLVAATDNAQIAAARPDAAFLGLGLASGHADSAGNVDLRLFIDNGGSSDVQASVLIEQAGTATTPASTVWAGSVRAPVGAAGTFDATIPKACGLRLSVLLTAPGRVRSLDVLVPCAAGA